MIPYDYRFLEGDESLERRKKRSFLADATTVVLAILKGGINKKGKTK